VRWAQTWDRGMSGNDGERWFVAGRNPEGGARFGKEALHLRQGANNKMRMLGSTLRLFRCVVIVTRSFAPERQLLSAGNAAAPTDVRGTAAATSIGTSKLNFRFLNSIPCKKGPDHHRQQVQIKSD